MTELLVWGLLVGAPAVPLAIAAFNRLTWPRPQPAQSGFADTSILIPARNEGYQIEATVRAALAQQPLEVVVYDDESLDDTAARVEALSHHEPKVRVLRGGPLPAGWVGKPHACHQLAHASRGPRLLFLDADVTLKPGGLAGLDGAHRQLQAAVITSVPEQRTQGWLEQLVVPLLHLMYLAWLPLTLVHRTQDRRIIAANGQLLMISRDTYEALGGYAAVRHEVVDDMALCKLAKQKGLRVAFVDGFDVASCRMYRSTREVWEGFSKNLYEGVGGRPIALAGVLGLNVTAFLLPPLALAMSWMEANLTVPAALGTSAVLTLRGMLAARYRQPIWTAVALHPVSMLVLVAIAINSMRWSLRGAIQWRGRTYAPRAQRIHCVARPSASSARTYASDNA